MQSVDSLGCGDISASDVWVLVDEYVGNANQARALARLMGWEGYCEKYLEYSLYARLPNILQFGLSGLARSSIKRLKPTDAPPKVIIGAGRRAARIAVELKRRYPGAQLLQIMRPQCRLRNFALVILPEHDRKPWAQYPDNVVFIPGALVCFPPGKLQEAAADLQKRLDVPSPYISLLIGGDTKNFPFAVPQFLELWRQALSMAKELDATLLISTSRRTPNEVVTVLKEQLKGLEARHYCYIYASDDPNPYLGMLGLSKRLIVTADSVAMCSEACATGKATYIYLPANVPSGKHRNFVESLFATGAAKPLSYNCPDFQSSSVGSYESLKHRIIEVIKG